MGKRNARQNKKIKDLLKRKGLLDPMADEKPSKKTSKEHIAFLVKIPGSNHPQRWVKPKAEPDVTLYGWKKAKQGIVIKQKTYNRFSETKLEKD